jgi:hypothetical protein
MELIATDHHRKEKILPDNQNKKKLIEVLCNHAVEQE